MDDKLKWMFSGTGKIGALFALGKIKKFRKQMDYKETGGSALLGVRRPVIKAVPYGPDFSAREINRLPAELILVDTYLPGMAGGTGETFDWRSAAKEIKKIKQSVLIAGGINVDNVKEAWDTFHPYGVDVSGGLETDGEKDIQKIQAFMQRVKVINRRKEMPKGLVVDEEHTGGDCPEEEGNCSGCQASNALG